MCRVKVRIFIPNEQGRAPRLSASAVVKRPRSRLCGDTDEILAEFGYPDAEIAGLRDAGVVR